MRAWTIPKLFVGLSVVIFIVVFLVQGITEEATRFNIRLSARISFIFFCAAFAASSLQYSIKGPFTFWLLMNRKFIGVTFAIIHLIHLGLLFLLQVKFHPVFEFAATSSLLAGGGAYVFIVLMLVSSFDSVKNRMNTKTWKFTHTIGIYWIAVVFLSTYGKRVIDELEFLPLFILLVIGFLLRFAKFLKKRF